MRIRILHTFFYPDMSAVSQIMTDVAFDLARHGHDVEVIASQGTYEGKEKLSRTENAGGVLIRRVWSPNLGKRSALCRLADLASFAAGGLISAISAPRADRIVVLTNPPMYALAGVLLKLFRREPYVYILMDLYPDIAVRAGVLRANALLTRFARWLSRITFRKAEKIVVLGTCMARAVERYGIPRDKIVIIRNWSDEDVVVPVSADQNPLRAELGYGDEFVVMYSGNMGVGHRFDDILQAALELRDRKDIRFLFVGGGVRRSTIEQFRDEHNLDNLTVRDYFPRSQLRWSLPLGDAHFVSLREGFEGLIVPSKTYGIMAAGRPVVYQGNPTGEIARMLLEEGGGEVIGEGDADALRETIAAWADDRQAAREIGRQARLVFERRYTRANGLRRYREVLQD